MRQPNKLRRAAIYGVAGLASAAIGVTAVNSLASAGADQAEPQNAAQAASAPGTQAAAPQTAAQAKPPATAQPHVPPTLAVKAAPQQPSAVKPAVKTAVRTAPKPVLRKKVKAVSHQKSLAPVKRATVTKQAVVRQHNPNVATVRKPSTANTATVIGNAQKALDQAGRDLASARQNLDKAKAEVDSLREQVGKVRLPKSPFASPKVSPALAKRLAEHRIGHTKKVPVKNTAHKKG